MELLFVAGLYVLVVFVGGAFLFQRWRWRRRKRSGRGRLGFYPRSAALGIALLQLQAVMEPQVRSVVEEKVDDASEDDDEGGPDDPTAHLLRQARRIQRGEVVDRLTALRR